MRHDATSLERKEGTAISAQPPFAFGPGDEEKEQAKMKSETRWSLDRRVPLAVILTIATQTAAALLWAGAAGERLAALELRTARLEEQTKSANASLARIEARLAR